MKHPVNHVIYKTEIHNMQFSVKQIGELLKAEVVGDENVQISSLSELQNAGQGDISFFSNKKYEDLLYNTKASAILVPKDFVASKELDAALLKVEDRSESVV